MWNESQNSGRSGSVRKEYFFVCLAMALFVLGMAGGMANTLRHPPAPRNAAVASFVVSRPVIRPGERTSIAVTVSTAGDSAYSWRADAGTLSVAGTGRVEWTAPASEGVYFISVAVSDPQGAAWHGSTRVVVTRRPGDPLAMSVIPHGRKTETGIVALGSSSTPSAGAALPSAK